MEEHRLYEFVVNKDSPHLGGNIWQGDPCTYSPTVWAYMIERFAVNSVLDVGAGRGHAAHWFHNKGCKVIAIDAEPINVKSSHYPIVQHDITAAPFICPVDFVHCQEVVEHIEEQYLGSLMRTLTNGNAVVISHAVPGQHGHHHVNCQNSDYWIAAMDHYGFNHMDVDTYRVRQFAERDGAIHLARSGLVFGRRVASQI